MLMLILRLGLLQKMSFFKKGERNSYITPFADLVAFVVQVILIALTFSILENGVNSVLILTGVDFFEMLGENIYFVLTTATTVGYGDILPTNIWSRLFVVLFIFFYLSARLIMILSRFSDAKTQVKEFKRIGRLFKNMENQIIVYCDAETIKRDNFLWLKRFVKENKLSTRFSENKILLVNHNEDASQILNDAMIANHNFEDRVVHMNINIDEENFFENIGIEKAKHVYVLGNPDDTHSDSKVFDFAYRIEVETKYDKDVTAEIVNDSNRKRMFDIGVDVIMRPNRSYPEMLVTATIAPGTASVLEELSSRGDDTLEVFSIPSEINHFVWSDLLLQLSVSGIGTAIGVVYNDKVDINPMGFDKITGGLKIVMMIHEMNKKSYEDQQSKINRTFKNISLQSKEVIL